MEHLHTNQYFTCSSGLAPAKMSSTQSLAKHDEGKYPLLTKQSTATSQMGDFLCRWTVVLAAAAVALVALTGGAALLALGAGKYFLGNMLFMQGVSRSIGVVDQVGFEGLLREGKNLGDAVKDHALEGFTMFEQPFINIYKKATRQVKDPQGNDAPMVF